jgi:2'-5' RNA ligase
VLTVELLGDDVLEHVVRDAWQRLHGAGLDSLARHRHPTNRPHLTLATAKEITPGAAALISGALTALPVDVRLDRLLFFRSRAGILAWAIDGGAALRSLQAEIWSALDGSGRNPLHEPRSWTPHITLARNVRPEHEQLAARAVGAPTAHGQLSRARSYDTVSRTAAFWS